MAQPNLRLPALTDKQLDELARITLQDIIITNEFVAKVVDRQYQNLLLASPEEAEEAINE